MGYGSDDARRTVRVSLGPPTSEADVLALCDALAEAAAAGRKG
jgi:cysteine sulfinate desulfinase/cysteine desulfurase-like protein